MHAWCQYQRALHLRLLAGAHATTEVLYLAFTLLHISSQHQRTPFVALRSRRDSPTAGRAGVRAHTHYTELVADGATLSPVAISDRHYMPGLDNRHNAMLKTSVRSAPPYGCCVSCHLSALSPSATHCK